ncbi:hypothetical protein BDV18DRAFT_143623 [Aspergillus unguis]
MERFQQSMKRFQLSSYTADLANSQCSPPASIFCPPSPLALSCQGVPRARMIASSKMAATSSRVRRRALGFRCRAANHSNNGYKGGNVLRTQCNIANIATGELPRQNPTRRQVAKKVPAVGVKAWPTEQRIMATLEQRMARRRRQRCQRTRQVTEPPVVGEETVDQRSIKAEPQ